MSSEFISKVDKEARRKAANILRDKFLNLVEQLKKGEPLVMEIPMRTLSNAIYDEKRKLLLLGEKKLKRNFLDLNEAKRFMQTVLMASIIYDALVSDEYPTIRDLYYRGKHSLLLKSIEGNKIVSEENTWDEQKESDSVIVDIEVFTSLLREEMLILSKEKGKVVGNLRIRSGNDVIDLSKTGHGAYAIEPTPDSKFLGVSMGDIFGNSRKKPYLSEAERKNYIIKAKDADIKRAEEIKNYEWFKTKAWQEEINTFLQRKAKLEIEAMASKGLKFLAFQYIPEKITNKDYIA